MPTASAVAQASTHGPSVAGARSSPGTRVEGREMTALLIRGHLDRQPGAREPRPARSCRHPAFGARTDEDPTEETAGDDGEPEEGQALADDLPGGQWDPGEDLGGALREQHDADAEVQDQRPQGQGDTDGPATEHEDEIGRA